MSTGMYVALLFGIGPLMALGLLALHRWQKHREDVAAWERAQEVRRRIREQAMAQHEAAEDREDDGDNAWFHDPDMGAR